MAASARSRKRRSSEHEEQTAIDTDPRAARSSGGLHFPSCGEWIRRCSVPDPVKREIGAILAISDGGAHFAVARRLRRKHDRGRTVGEGLTWVVGRGAILFRSGSSGSPLSGSARPIQPVRRRRFFGMLLFCPLHRHVPRPDQRQRWPPGWWHCRPCAR